MSGGGHSVRGEYPGPHWLVANCRTSQLTPCVIVICHTALSLMSFESAVFAVYWR